MHVCECVCARVCVSFIVAWAEFDVFVLGFGKWFFILIYIFWSKFYKLKKLKCKTKNTNTTIISRKY